MTPKPKYEVRIYPPDVETAIRRWRAVLICNCGTPAEHTAVESPYLDFLIDGVRCVLVEHEKGVDGLPQPVVKSKK